MIRIIPAIDLIDGKCVRLNKGEYATRKIYNENPLDVARSFEDNGLEFLHLVDLDGAKAGKIINWKILESIAAKTNLKIDFGGGVRSADDIKTALDSGAVQVNCGSVAARNPAKFQQWLHDFGTTKLILSSDVRHEKIAINAWQDNTEINIFDFILQFQKNKLEYICCTDIEKDGEMKGSSVDLYKKLKAEFPDLKIIASGGVSSIAELEALNALGLDGAIIGKAIYEKTISLKELSQLC